MRMRAFAWAGAGLFGASLAAFAYLHATAWGRPAPPATNVLAAVSADLALFTTFALHHSILARAGAKRWLTRRVPPALERTLYVWVASLLFLAVCGLWQPLPGMAWQASGAAHVLLRLTQLTGLVLTWRSAARLDIWDLAGIRQVERGSAHGGSAPTPRAAAEAAPTAMDAPLESGGPYGWVRHPIYLGWVLIVWAVPVMTQARLLWAVVSTAYLIVAIPIEERGLVAEFGATYRDYQRRVRWRLVPGIW